MKKILACMLILTTLSLSSQEKVPEPYMPEEFHPALHDIRRGSIIFCGAFPSFYFWYLIFAVRKIIFYVQYEMNLYICP